MKNIKLIVAFDGTRSLGWQKSKEGSSVEESLQNALEKILGEKISLIAASRTDAKVHAKGQVVNFFSQKNEVDLQKLHIGLNGVLPCEISVTDVKAVPNTFHATHNAKMKEYEYFVCNSFVQLPQNRLYSWHYIYPLNLKEMKEAAEHLIGTHDFASFCNTKKNEVYSNTIRTVEEISIKQLSNDRLCFTLKANSFLYKMARNIVGTLVYVGHGKLKSDDIPFFLSNRQRELIGVTAPAHGLTLHKVYY